MEEDTNLEGGSAIIAGLLDPVAEAIEKGLKKTGLGKVAKAWIKGESTVLLLGLLNGMAKGGADYVAKTTGPAVMNLSVGKEVIPPYEIDEAMLSAGISALEGFADTMELSPSYQIDEAIKKTTGKYGGEHLINAAQRLGKTITK